MFSTTMSSIWPLRPNVLNDVAPVRSTMPRASWHMQRSMHLKCTFCKLLTVLLHHLTATDADCSEAHLSFYSQDTFCWYRPLPAKGWIQCSSFTFPPPYDKCCWALILFILKLLQVKQKQSWDLDQSQCWKIWKANGRTGKVSWAKSMST